MTEQELTAIEARANAAVRVINAARSYATKQKGPTLAQNPHEAMERARQSQIELTASVQAYDTHAPDAVSALVAELKAYRRALLDACGDLAGQAGGTAEGWAEKLVADARAALAA